MIAEVDQNASAPAPLQELMKHLEAADKHVQWLHHRFLYIGEASSRLESALEELAQVAFCAGQLRVGGPQ